MTSAEVISTVNQHSTDIAVLKQKDLSLTETVQGLAGKFDRFVFLLVGTLLSSLGACVLALLNLTRGVK